MNRLIKTYKTKKLLMVIFTAGLLGIFFSCEAFAYTYATEALWSGTTVTGSQRSDPQNALGAEDGSFLSLGLGGMAVFGFGTSFAGTAEIVEITWNRENISNYLETADVYVGNTFSLDQSSFTYVTSITNNVGSSSGTSLVDLSGLGPFKYLLIVDTTPVSSDSTDGFDVDSVGVNPVPIPGAFWLFGSGLFGLVGFRRKWSKL